MVHNSYAKENNTEFANSVDPNEEAHNEPPPLYLHCFCLLALEFTV